MTTPLIIFGGTFDPVHLAHVRGARAVSAAFHGTPVQMLPNALPPHRGQPGSEPSQRLAMLALACDPYPELQINDWELNQSGPSWTRRTLAHLREEIGERPLLLVIGADSLAGFHTWRDWQDFPGLCHLVVLPRPGAKAPHQEVLNAFPEAGVEDICESPAGRRLMMAGPCLDMSATAVRQDLVEKGTSEALDPAVLAHIRAHGLYNVSQEGSRESLDHTRNHDGDA